MATHPIILVESDEDEDLLIGTMLQRIAPDYPIVRFSTAYEALTNLKTDYLQPFLILCELNLPGMNGLEFRQALLADKRLKVKSIPFIFLANPVSAVIVEQAYQLMIQGFLDKKSTLAEQRVDLQSMIDYWSRCRHPILKL